VPVCYFSCPLSVSRIPRSEGIRLALNQQHTLLEKVRRTEHGTVISSFVGMVEWRRHGSVLVSVDVIYPRAYRHRLFHVELCVHLIRRVS